MIEDVDKQTPNTIVLVKKADYKRKPTKIKNYRD